MPYGNNSPLVGSNIDPRLFVQDYSGYTDAANDRAATISNAVGKVVGAGVDYTKQQKEDKNRLKSGVTLIDAASKMFPSQAPAFQEVSMQLKDENIPLSERAAIASQVGELINMGVGEGRYKQEMEMEQTKLDNATQESSMRQWAYGQEVTKGEREAAAYALDTKTKATIGPALLESVLQMAPASISGEVRKSLTDATPEQQYSIANSVMSLIPKRDTKAPAVQDVAVDGGTMKMQWDGAQWVPIQTNLAAEPMGDPAALNLPEFATGPIDELEQELGMVLPPKNPVGFKPDESATPTVTEQIAVKKYNDEKQATDAKGAISVAEAEGFKSTLVELAKHPGFSGLFGISFPWATSIPGSDAADAKAILGKVQGMAFLEAIQKMKGMGALSEKEGQTATKAYSALTPEMSELAALKEIKSLKEKLDVGIQRQKTGQLVNPDGTPKVTAPPDPVMDAANRLRGYIQPR